MNTKRTNLFLLFSEIYFIPVTKEVKIGCKGNCNICIKTKEDFQEVDEAQKLNISYTCQDMDLHVSLECEGISENSISMDCKYVHHSMPNPSVTVCQKITL